MLTQIFISVLLGSIFECPYIPEILKARGLFSVSSPWVLARERALEKVSSQTKLGFPFEQNRILNFTHVHMELREFFPRILHKEIRWIETAAIVPSPTSTPAPGLDSRKTHRHFARKRIPTCSLFRFRILISPPPPPPLPRRNGKRRGNFRERQTCVTCARKARRPRKKILNFRSKGNYARVKSPFMSLPVSTPVLKRGERERDETSRSCERGQKHRGNVAWCRNDRITWLMLPPSPRFYCKKEFNRSSTLSAALIPRRKIDVSRSPPPREMSNYAYYMTDHNYRITRENTWCT